MSIKNVKFITHTGNECPVRPGAIVAYRTTVEDGLGHIHAPMFASELNWREAKGRKGDPASGRISEYTVVR